MQAKQVAEGIKNGNYGLPNALRCKKLMVVNHNFFAKLREEVTKLLATNNPSDVGYSTHGTNWTKPYGDAKQWNLLSQSGFNNEKDMTGFNRHSEYPYIGKFIDTFKHSVTSFRLNRMGPMSGLAIHKEHTIHKKNNIYYARARFHLPLFTNDKVRATLDEDVVHLPEQCISYFNNGTPHSAYNHGSSARYHFVWDMTLNQQTFNQMFGNGSLPDFLDRQIEDIEVLERIDTGEYPVDGGAIPLSEIKEISVL